MAAEPVRVVQGADRGHEQVVMARHGFDDAGVEGQELEVLHRGLAGGEEIDAGIGAQRPVAVLSAAVDSVEGLFMEEHLEVVLFGHFLHDDHQQHVLIDGRRDFPEDRGAFELVGSHFVMTGLERNAEFVGLRFEILHESDYPGGNGSEIMVGQLLVLGGGVSDHGPVAQLQVGPGVIQVFVHKEILLLQADIGADAVDIGVEDTGHGGGRLVQGVQRTQVGDLHVEGLSGVGDEDGRDTQRTVQHEGRGIRVPGGIAPGLEGVAQASVRETGGVRLLLHQGAAPELFKGAAVPDRHERLVFLGGRAGERLEEMGVMGCPPFDCPGFHACGDFVSKRPVDFAAGFPGLQDGLESSVGHVPAHGFKGKNILAEVRRHRPAFHGVPLGLA